jgi:hypothetical protein
MKTFVRCLILCLILRGSEACRESPVITDDNTTSQPTDTCSLKNVRYKNRIQGILTQHCTLCHGNITALKGINFESYEGAKAWFQLDSARILGTVRYEALLNMPPAGKIPACQIQQLELWVREGFAE